jgi:hypothetical protein
VIRLYEIWPPFRRAVDVAIFIAGAVVLWFVYT